MITVPQTQEDWQAERLRHTDRESTTETERIDRARDSGREQRGEGGRRYFTQPRQGTDVSICCCNRHTQIHICSPDVKHWDSEGSGNPFTLLNTVCVCVFVCAHVYMLTCVCVREHVKWATVAKYPRGGEPVSWLSI